MKKKLLLLTCAALMSICMATPVSAADDTVKVTINGKQVQFAETDGAPFVDAAGRAQVPMRKTMEEFGCMVSWEQEIQTASVTKDRTALGITIGKNEIDRYSFTSDGEEPQSYTTSLILNDTAATVQENRTYLPIRVIAEAFGGTVTWNNNTRTVMITVQSEPVNLRAAQTGTSDVTLDLSPLQYLGGTLENLKASFGQPSEAYSLAGGIWYYFKSANGTYAFPLEPIFADDLDPVFNPENESSYTIENRCVDYISSVSNVLKGIDKPLYQSDIEKIFGANVTYYFNIDELGDGYSPSAYKLFVKGYNYPLSISCNLNGQVNMDDTISASAN